MTVRILPWALALLLATPIAAQESPIPDPETVVSVSVHPQARWAIDRIKSPYCPGLMLAVCTSAGGAMLRDSIQSMAVVGMTGEAILERVLAEHGEEWRAEPRFRGQGVWAWLMPPVGLAAGLAVVGIVLARRKRERGEPQADNPVSPQDQERLRQALHDLELAERPDY